MKNKVILISVDGMRPDGVMQCENPYVEELMKMSSYTMNARTVFPSVTLPCHMSMFHSVPVASPEQLWQKRGLPRVVLTPRGFSGLHFPGPPIPRPSRTLTRLQNPRNTGHLLAWTQAPRAGRGSALPPQPWGQHPGEIPRRPTLASGPRLTLQKELPAIRNWWAISCY